MEEKLNEELVNTIIARLGDSRRVYKATRAKRSVWVKAILVAIQRSGYDVVIKKKV